MIGKIFETILILGVLLAGFVTFLAFSVFVANNVLRLIRERGTR